MTSEAAVLEAILRRTEMWPAPSVAVAVVTADGIVAGRGPLDEQFSLASVTKPLAALATLVAIEEGALDYGDPADETLLPGATLRHLLAHASGIAPEGRMRSFGPAERRVYSNVGIEMAAGLVESAVQMPFAAYLHEAVAEPLGMTGTKLAGSPARDGVATVADLAVVMQNLIAPQAFPRFLHQSTVLDATTVQYPGLRGVLPGFGAQDPNDWGLGFEIRNGKQPHWTGTRNSPSTYGHFGQSGTMFWIDPFAALGLVVLTDRAFGDWAREEWPKLADAVLAAHATFA
jgi:CubicO group peptidase (beta-lactamase class C family)